MVDKPVPVQRALLRRHAALVLIITALVAVGAYGYARTRQPTYTATARVLVQPYTLPSAANPTPDMGTEQSIASSGAVLTNAAAALHMSEPAVRKATTVSISPNADVLDFAFNSSQRTTATSGATAVAAAYMAYRVRATVSSHRAAVTQALATPKVQTRLITSASLPGTPSSPDVLIDVIAGIIVGLIAGGAVAFVTDRFSRRMRTIIRWQEATRVAVLVTLARRKRLEAVTDAHDAKTTLALSYLRMRVSQSLRAPAVLLVTEVRPQRDRAALARFLAAELADMGCGVALIEVSAEATATAGASVRMSVVSQSGHELGAPGEWEATTGQGLLRTVDRHRANYDIVVVTGPSPLRSVTTLDVAGLADAAILLDNVRSARRVEALRAITELRTAGCEVLGAVLLGVGTSRVGDAAAFARNEINGGEPHHIHQLPLRTLAPLVAWTQPEKATNSHSSMPDHADGSQR
jgi:succinoglycan biosynthesis transport protein ExoP